MAKWKGKASKKPDMPSKEMGRKMPMNEKMPMSKRDMGKPMKGFGAKRK